MSLVQEQIIELKGEAALIEFAANFAKHLLPRLLAASCTVFLQGELGAGKTTFVRGFLRGLGYTEVVKSPSYSLIESYELCGKTIQHFDLYRNVNPQALEARGIRDYFHENSVCFIEWPENGGIYLPKPDIKISLLGRGESRTLHLSACSSYGGSLIR